MRTAALSHRPKVLFVVAALLCFLIYNAATAATFFKVWGLTFSSTQTWDSATYTYAVLEPFLVTASYTLPQPPGNYSLEVFSELRQLHGYKALRTEETLKTIEDEIKTGTMVFNGVTYDSVTDLSVRPETNRLLTVTHEDFKRHIVRAKYSFDRVRPSYLDPTLETAIAVPGHPAYPSGHAGETYLYALLLGALDPEHQTTYIADAYRIALNREIAGVHYPSDSEAGRELAKWYFEALQQLPWYQDQLERAKAEW